MMCKERLRRVCELGDIEEYLASNRKFRGRDLCKENLPYLVARTDSPAEANLVAFLAINGIEGMEPNYEVRLRNGRRRFIDLAFPAIKLGLEYQGAYHSNVHQMCEDANRMNQLIDIGWSILQITANDMRTQDSREHLLAKIQRAITRQTAVNKLIHNS